MLLRFRVTNHLSFRNEQELSLVAENLRAAEHTSITFPLDHVPGLRGERGLPVAILYGANASGKSNLVQAIRYMRGAVLNSQRAWDPEGAIARTPFALDPSFVEMPTRFEMDFVIDGRWYQYGFELTEQRITGEWLYAYPHGRRARMFQRDATGIRFGKSLTGEKDTISRLTRKNSLFVSAGAQNDHPLLSKVWMNIRNILGFEVLDVRPQDVKQYFHKEGNIDYRVIKFLNSVGTGVVDYKWESVTDDKNVSTADDFFTMIKQEYRQKFENLRPMFEAWQKRLMLFHEVAGGGSIPLDLSRESAGTRRLLMTLSEIFRALDHGTPFVLDEIDSSLHTLAVEHILELFASEETNPYGAQLITTTHDTNLLRSAHLRRDEIWFTEKDRTGATQLYPLTDFSPRASANLEKGYLLGRYGAIPFAGPLPEELAGSKLEDNGQGQQHPAAEES